MNEELKRAILESTGRIHVPWEGQVQDIFFLTHNNTVTTKGNKREVIYTNGVRILFSYKTPVAGEDDFGFFRTDMHHSQTTSKHISGYVDNFHATRIVPQNELDQFEID